MKIITADGNQSGIELMMKYCSKLGNMLGYPYYFNWSAPTNHRDTKPDGETSDIGYASIRCGVYPQHPTVGRLQPVEKEIMFGPVNLIVNNHTALNILISIHDNKVETWNDIETNIDILKIEIDRYLRDQVIAELNRSISAYNKEYNENVSMVGELDLSQATDEQRDMIKTLTQSCRKQLEDSGVSDSDIDDILSNGIKD